MSACHPECASRCHGFASSEECSHGPGGHACDCGASSTEPVASPDCADCGRPWEEHEFGVPKPGCPSPVASAPKRRIKVRPAHGGQWCVCDDWDGVGQMIEDDGAYEFAFVMMTDEEADALGEFNGW